jgi:hypothetical protein
MGFSVVASNKEPKSTERSMYKLGGIGRYIQDYPADPF